MEKVISMLASKGIKAYAVGGYPRDVLSGKKPKDVDLTTPVLPHVVREKLGKMVINDLTDKTIKYGIVNFFFDGEVYEIATFRRDLDSKRDTGVQFVQSLEEDAVRRDFTINAIYMTPEGVIDPVGGAEDLRVRRLRTVGSPLRRFEEDPSRILRAVRFIAEGFTPADDLLEVLKDTETIRSLLKRVSKNIMRKNLVKFLQVDPKRAIFMLRDFGILDMVLPMLAETVGFEQGNPHHVFDLFTHQVYAAEYVHKEGGDYLVVLAALLHDLGKVETKKWNEKKQRYVYYGHAEVSAEKVRKEMKGLHFSKKEIRKVVALVRNHMKINDAHSIYQRRKLISELGELISDLKMLWAADDFGKNRRRERVIPAMDDEVLPLPVSSAEIVEIVRRAGLPAKEAGALIKAARKMWLKNHDLSPSMILGNLRGIAKSIAAKYQG